MAGHNIYVFVESEPGVLSKVKINPTITAALITDLGDAIDGYKQAFIDPDIEALGLKIQGLPGLFQRKKCADLQEALTYSDNNRGVFAYVPYEPEEEEV